jgi:K+-sensing histidine kinase KdpD
VETGSVDLRFGRWRTGWGPLWGVLVAVIGLGAATGLLLPAREHLSLASVALLYLLPVVATAAVGGVRPALAGAVAADLLVNFFFVPPYHTLVVDRGDNLIALIVYIIVAAAMAVAVESAARSRAAAARRTVEAALLAGVTTEPVAGNSLIRLLEQATGGGAAVADGAGRVGLRASSARLGSAGVRRGPGCAVPAGRGGCPYRGESAPGR